MSAITAEIISVGDELLCGAVVNTNAAFLAGELAKLGIAVLRQTVVGDSHARLAAALGQAEAELIIAAGGLGPTQDDITKGAAAECFGLKTVTALLPNGHGCAPGICMERGGKTLILLPGPPHEMEPMFTRYAVPFLREKTGGGKIFLSRTLKIIGLGETKVEALLKDLFGDNPAIAPYAKVGEVHVRLTAAAENAAAARGLIDPLAAEIYNRLRPNIYGEDGATLAEVVIGRLKSRGHTLALAESCTGGLITSDLVAVPGCSAVLREGLVTYANESKAARLGVDESVLNAHGAVSPQAAAAMARGAAETGGASVGLSVTGIAGPGGGTPQKPVGLVFMGLHIDGQTCTASHRLAGSRGVIRARAAKLALDMLRRALEYSR